MGYAILATVVTLIATAVAAFTIGWMGQGVVAGVAVAVMGGFLIAAIERNK